MVVLPFTVKPRSGDDEVGVLRIVFFSVAEDFPRTPGVFLVPEAGNVEIGNSGGVKLVHPGFLLPEIVVNRMVQGRIPERDRAVEILGIQVGERAKIEIPLIGVIRDFKR